MKKILIILIMLFIVVGCSNGKNMPFGGDESETNKQDITIDIWDVDPVYEYDDIDVDFINDNNNFDVFNNYPHYSIDSPYKNHKKGSFLFIKNDGFGIANDKGEVIINPNYKRMLFMESTELEPISEDEQLYDSPYLNDDLSLEYSNYGFAQFGLGVGGFTGFAYNKENKHPTTIKYNFVEKYIESEGDVDLLDFAKSFYENNSINTVLFTPFYVDNNHPKVFAIIDDSGETLINCDNDYFFNDFSDNVIMLYKNLDYEYSEGNYIANLPKYYSTSGFRYPAQRDKIITHVAYYDTNANLIGEYDNGYGFYEGYAPVKKDGKWGYIDKQNNVVIDFIFDKATPLCDGKAWVIYNGRTGRLNIKDMLDNNVPFNDEVLNVEGYELKIDIWNVNPIYKYDDIDADFLNDNSRFLYPQPYYSIDNFYQNYKSGSIIIVKDNRIGYINDKGDVVVNTDFIHIFHYNTNTQLEPFKYDDTWQAPWLNYDYSLEYEGSGFAAVGGAGGWTKYTYNNNGYICETRYSAVVNKIESEIKMDMLDFARKKYNKPKINSVLVSTDFEDDNHSSQLVIVDEKEIKLIDCDKDYLFYDFSDDIITLVKTKYEIGIQSSMYNSRDYYSGIRNPAGRDKIITHVAYYDTNANLIGEYDNGYGFYEGYAPVKKDGKWGYIDKQNNVVIDFIFDKATPLCDGKAWVIYNGRTGRLNIKDMLDNNVPFNDEVLNVDDYVCVSKWIKVKVNDIRIRSASSTYGEIVGHVYKDSIFNYMDEYNDGEYTWYKIGNNKWIADKNGEWITILD